MKEKMLMKVLVGSRAHGLHTEESDYDFRGVYVTPTETVLSLDYKYKGSHWFEGQEDQTTYELLHFLQLATRCNPSILEVFVAPQVVDVNDGQGGTHREYFMDGFGDDAEELKALFPAVWNPKDAFNAFVGYGLNQRKKMLDKKDARPRKYAVAYLRTLWNLYDLLTEGTFTLEIRDPDFKKELEAIKYGQGYLDMGHIINRAECLTAHAEGVLPHCNHKPDLKRVNDFLIKMRRKYFNE